MNNATSMIRAAAVCVLLLALAACSSKDSELDQFIASTMKQPGGAVEQLPEIRPYEAFNYAAQTMRSPFMPGGNSSSSTSNLRPDSKRNREFLEQFSLDQLRMVGTLKLAGQNYGLVKTKDGLVQRVLPGNYIGQRDGRVTDIEPSRITLIEIVPDGLGGYMERPASLALND